MKETIIKRFEELLLDHRHQLEDLLISKEYYRDICIGYLTGARLVHGFTNEEIEQFEEFEELSGKKIMLELSGQPDKFYGNYTYPNYNKISILHSYIAQYVEMINRVNNLEVLPCPQDLEKYLNPYGLFIDRKHVYFKEDFYDLDNETRILVFMQELIHSYAKAKHDCEGLLGLYHLKLINNKIPYAQSKRSKLIEIYKEKYGEFEYIWKPSREKTKYIKNLVKEKTLLGDKCDEKIYYRKRKYSTHEANEEYFILITQYAGV